MAKKITIDIEVNGKMQKATLSAKKLREELDGVDKNQKKTTKSAGELDRNIKGVAQTSANGAKNFSKMSQGMGGLVGVYATIAAQVFAITAAFQLFKSATDFSNLIKGQEALGAATGIAYKTITGSIQEATDAQLGYAEAARAAAIGTSAGLSPDQLTRLGSAAKNASIALGRDLGDSFDRLVRGVVKAEPEVLDELGIILRLAPATEKYAQSIGKAADELTAFERSQAVANEVLGQAEEKFGLIEAQLDPSVAALNQFLKAFDDIKKSIFEFAAGPIASFATFLSKNILALAGVLGLFGLSIARTIIPNLHDWKNASKETIEENKTKLAELRGELEATKQKYLQVNATQADLGKGTDLIKGVSGNKAPTKGALGFIAGGTTDKRAQAAAARSLDNANKQLKEFGKVKSGILKKFSKEEIAILNETFLQREALLKRGEASFNKSMEANKLKLKELKLGFILTGAQATGFFARVSAGAARLLSAFGWIGLIVSVGTILFDLGKKVFEYFNGVDEVQKSVNEKVDATIDKYKTLNAEIERSQQFLANNAVSGSTAVVAEAGQVQSLDVKSLIEDVNSLTDPAVKASENYDDLKEKLLNTAKAGGTLTPAFDAVSDAINNNRNLSDQEVLVLEGVARAMGSVKTAFAQSAAQIDATNAAIDKLINTVKKPFGSELGQQLEAELKGLQIQVTALQGKLAEEITIPVDDAELNQAQKKLDDAQRRFGRGVELRFNDEGQAVGATRNGRELGNIEGRLQQYKNALATRNARQQELTEAEEASRKKTEEQLKAITDRQVYLQNIQTATGAVEEENTARLESQRTALDKIAKERTNGLNAAEKIKNLGLDELKNQQDLVPLKNKEAVQNALITTLEEKKKANGDKLSKIEQKQLENAQASLKQTESEIVRLEARNKLAEDLNVITAKRLQIQEKIAIAGNVSAEIQARQKITSELQREFNLRKQIADVRRKMSIEKIDMNINEKAVSNPFFEADRAKAQATLDLERSTMKARSDQIDEEYNNKIAAIDLEYELLDAQKEAQALRLEALAYEVKVRDGEGTELEAKLNKAATSFRGIDYSGPKEAAQDLAKAHRDAAKQGLKKTVQDAELAVIKVQRINQVLMEAGKAFETALNDAFNTVFDYLSGEVEDLNEALKEIGRGLLQTIQEAVTQKLIIKPLLDMVGLSDADPSQKIQQAHTTGAQAVSTAITTGASTMQTSIETALNSAEVKVCCCSEDGPAAPIPSELERIRGLGSFENVLKDEGFSQGQIDAARYDPAVGDTFLQSSDSFGSDILSDMAGESAGEGQGMFAGLGKMFKGFTGKIGKLFSGDNQFFKGLKGVFDGALGGFGGIFDNLLGSFGSMFGDLFGSLGGLFGGGGGGMGGLLSGALSMIPGIGPILGGITSIFGFKNGGIMDNGKKMQGYANGGIAKGPKSGHLAMLHGKEAVVPLPKGNSIPVEMNGTAGSMQNNNVTVNVSTDGQTQSTSNGPMAEGLGQVIAAAVQKELHNQKRAGGILNKHGAA